MRKIIFRGKRIDNGEWVYGFYCYNPHMKRAEIFSFTDIQSYVYEVDPETVGQYTGLLDKNDVRMFEGDFLKEENGGLLVVAFVEGAFCHQEIPRFLEGVDIASGFDDTDYYLNQEDREVVGNIHDNPELLKGGE